MITIKAETFKIKSSLSKINKDYRIGMQEAMAFAMVNTRLKAHDNIIKNVTGYISPYMAYKEQTATPGRLTSRTGKLRYMLRNKASKSNPLSSWTKAGTKLMRENTVALKGLIRAFPNTGLGAEEYEGTYRVYITGDGYLFSANPKRRVPPETKRTLRMRFMWETGIRGQKRPIFAPVINEAEYDFRKRAEMRLNQVWRLS